MKDATDMRSCTALTTARCHTLFMIMYYMTCIWSPRLTTRALGRGLTTIHWSPSLRTWRPATWGSGRRMVRALGSVCLGRP
ncbi:Os04g0581050 [Oryza sativa Japonica Group]|uniref:Os04g0581050 protein n=1 Tax=Oryza sativa subsp. japonica TaxID=39947 RepID=A0A0N7KJK2_ORYSJ|nr:Os04g0581050 [Oryza sativa Japonica Group]